MTRCGPRRLAACWPHQALLGRIMNGRGVTRRAILTSAWSATTLALPGLIGTSRSSQASDGPLQPEERNAISDVAYGYMAKFKIPGLSVAIGKDGEIVYAEGFGVVSPLLETRVNPSHLFRIASISKPITSVGIFSLVEQSRLSLTNRVFGEHGILPEYQLPANDQFIGEITVDHLLTHTVGGWSNEKGDPMNVHLDMDHQHLIAWTLENMPLPHQPGTRYVYSNFGYCLLGRVIEKITGQSYADYVRQSVLEPSQAKVMRIAGNSLQDRADGEVIYHRQDGDAQPYGMNVARMDANAGWLASPSDLVRLLNHVYGKAQSAVILKPGTLSAMTTPSVVDSGYARGWYVTGLDRWHPGSLPGTSAIMVHTPSGLCWAALANSRDAQSASWRGLHEAVFKMVRRVKAWNAEIDACTHENGWCTRP
jgi:CubicO group peptidase (beta-lactamase class C family)